MRWITTAAGIAIAFLVAGCGSGGENGSILVTAAASLTDALTEAGESFETTSGVRVEFNFGGSNALARQITLGAPADVVILAGAEPMDRLEDGGEIKPETRVDLLRNRLVLIGRTGTVAPAALGDLEGLGGRIALADPQLAPAGLYAQQALEASGVWGALQDRLIPTLDVRAAVGAVDAGSARYALVYETDAAAVRGVEVLLTVPDSSHEAIVYPAAVVAGSGGVTRAAEFIAFLRSVEAALIFERHGFTPKT